MGKAADNERIKLNATWFNNASVGLALGGALVPYLALISGLTPSVSHALVEGYRSGDIHPFAPFFIKVWSFFLAFIFSGICFFVSRRQISKLQD
jgi:amino acid permease